MDEPNDWIRDAVADAAASQGLTAYAISQQLEGRPTKEAVHRYLAKRCHLGTQHVSRICDVLKLELSSKRKSKA
jgi:hypothetical protein